MERERVEWSNGDTYLKGYETKLSDLYLMGFSSSSVGTDLLYHWMGSGVSD
jgi:hypothetical protein